MDNSLIVDGLDIRELNDDDLLGRLQTLGFNPGPILSSTREVYQRKLARLLRNEEFDESEGNENDLQVEDDYPVSPVLSSSFESGYSGSPSVDELRRRPLSRFEDDKWSDNPPTLSPHKSWSPDDIVTQVQPPPQEEEKSYMSSTTVAIAIFVVLAFAFLVYYNMESTPETPFT